MDRYMDRIKHARLAFSSFIEVPLQKLEISGVNLVAVWSLKDCFQRLSRVYKISKSVNIDEDSVFFFYSFATEEEQKAEQTGSLSSS